MPTSIDLAVIYARRGSSAFHHCDLAWLSPMPRCRCTAIAIFGGRLEGVMIRPLAEDAQMARSISTR